MQKELTDIFQGLQVIEGDGTEWSFSDCEKHPLDMEHDELILTFANTDRSKVLQVYLRGFDIDWKNTSPANVERE